MARPLKDGIGYFPLDVDYLNDKKVRLVKTEFGPMGVIVFLQVLAEIYKNNGYYMVWDSREDSLLMADSIGCGCTADRVAEIVQGCVRRSIFDSGVSNVFGVLTSPGIQRRYLRAVAERSNIYLIKEYCLLDTSNKKDVPEGISKKITFCSVNPQINEVNLHINPVDLQINPQSKVKESKENKSKEKDIGVSKSPRFVPPPLSEVAAYCRVRHNNVDPEGFLDFYTANGWKQGKGKPIVDWMACMRTWEKDQRRELPKTVLPNRSWTDENEARPVRRGNKNWEGVE